MQAVEVQIDSCFDVAFCLFAGLRDEISAKWRSWKKVVRALREGEDPTSAMKQVLAETACIRQTGAPFGTGEVSAECFPGYVRLAKKGMTIELYYDLDAVFSIRVGFDTQSRVAARRIAQYIYESYEGEILSAAVAMVEIDSP